MSIADDIIKKLKDVPFEEQSRTEIEILRVSVMAAKGTSPLIAPILKVFLRDQLVGPRGHAKDALAKRLFNHYLDRHGQLYVLTLDDMKAMNAAKIDIRKKNPRTQNPAWSIACMRAKGPSGGPQDYSGNLAWIWDDGAIANYTVTYAGKITASRGACIWEGSVSYYDRFDLDPRWGWSTSNPQGRSRGGERRTRIGYILDLGTDFDIKSPKAVASQKETDLSISFSGSIVPGSTPAAGDI